MKKYVRIFRRFGVDALFPPRKGVIRWEDPKYCSASYNLLQRIMVLSWIKAKAAEEQKNSAPSCYLLARLGSRRARDGQAALKTDAREVLYPPYSFFCFFSIFNALARGSWTYLAK